MDHYNKDPHLWDNIDSDKSKNDFDQNNKYFFNSEPWTLFKNPSQNIWRPNEGRFLDSISCLMTNCLKFWLKPKIPRCTFFILGSKDTSTSVSRLSTFFNSTRKKKCAAWYLPKKNRSILPKK